MVEFRSSPSLIRGWLLNELEMGTWVWCVPSFISPHSQIDWFGIEQRQLHDASYTASTASGGQFRGFPIEQPLARSQVKQGQLRGTERSISQARMADRLQMLVIVLQLDAVLGKRHGLMLDLERALIDPNRDRSLRKVPFSVELPVLETQVPVLVEAASEASSEQDTVEELC